MPKTADTSDDMEYRSEAMNQESVEEESLMAGIYRWVTLRIHRKTMHYLQKETN